MTTSFPSVEITSHPTLDEKKLREELDAKSLQDLMDFKRQQDEETKQRQDILDQVRKGNLSALGTLDKPRGKPVTLSKESLELFDKMLNDRGLAKDKIAIYANIPNEPDSQMAMLTQLQERADRLFGPDKIQCVFAKDKDGNDCIVSVGASAAEITTINRIDYEKRIAEHKAKIAEEVIKQKVTRQQSSVKGETLTTLSPLPTPQRNMSANKSVSQIN